MGKDIELTFDESWAMNLSCLEVAAERDNYFWSWTDGLYVFANLARTGLNGWIVGVKDQRQLDQRNILGGENWPLAF